MPKFDIKKHEERMRKLLEPPTPISPLAERIRIATRKRRLPKMPRI